MASNLLWKRCFPTQHVTHDLAERGRVASKYFQSFQSMCNENKLVKSRDAISIYIMVNFQIKGNLKEAVVRPVLLSSSSTSLPIRSLNDVGDCVLLCGGGRTLCLACAKKVIN